MELAARLSAANGAAVYVDYAHTPTRWSGCLPPCALIALVPAHRSQSAC